jgi:hypothetical protein
MNLNAFGLFLICYGIFKIAVTGLNEVAPDNIRKEYLEKIPVLGHIFEDYDTTFARHAFNICFFLYGIHTLIHGLVINNFIHIHPWIISRDANYAIHAFLGVFMFTLYYTLLKVNSKLYIVEGVYSGLAMLATMPIIYLFRGVKRTFVEKVVSYFSLFVLCYVGATIMWSNPDRVPNVFDIIGIILTSF